MRSLHTIEKELQIGWALIPPYIISREDLSQSEKLIFGRIMGLLEQTGYCWASNYWLGKQIGLKPDTVSGIISTLKDKGLIDTKIYRDDNKKITARHIFMRGTAISPIGIGDSSDTPIGEKPVDSVENNRVESSNMNNTNSAMELNPDLSLLEEKYIKKEKTVGKSWGTPQKRPTFNGPSTRPTQNMKDIV